MRYFQNLEDIGTDTLFTFKSHDAYHGYYTVNDGGCCIDANSLPINLTRMALMLSSPDAQPTAEFMSALTRYSKRCARLRFLALLDEFETAYALRCVARTDHVGGLRGIEALSINSDLCSAPYLPLLDNVKTAFPKLTAMVLKKPVFNWDAFVERFGATLTRFEVHFETHSYFRNWNLHTVEAFSRVARFFVNADEVVIYYIFSRSIDIAKEFDFFKDIDVFPHASTIRLVAKTSDALFGVEHEDIEKFERCEREWHECRPHVQFFVHPSEKRNEYQGSLLGGRYGPAFRRN